MKREVRFKDRCEAGKILASKLERLANKSPLVLALPRGGVPVAFEVARSLKADLDILLVKKIGLPGQEELALGALAEGGRPYWNSEVLSLVPFSQTELAAMAENKAKEIAEQAEALRGDRDRIEIKDRMVILVDDGLATGSTMVAALEMLKLQGPKKIVVAVPVASKQAVQTIEPVADEVIVVHVPAEFWSVGLWYEDFTQVSNDEVKELLAGRSTDQYLRAY